MNVMTKLWFMKINSKIIYKIPINLEEDKDRNKFLIRKYKG